MNVENQVLPREIPSEQKNWITEFTEQVTFFENISDLNLAIWIKEAINGFSKPIWTADLELLEFLDRIFLSSNEQARTKLKTVIYKLLREWSRHNDTFEVLSALIYLAGLFKITNAYDLIKLWLVNRDFVDCHANPEHPNTIKDVHLTCLKTAFSLAEPNDGLLKKIWLRDAADDDHPLYFGISYRGLFSKFLEDSRHFLFEHFPKYVDLCISGYYVFSEGFYYVFKTQRDVLYNESSDLLNQLTSKQLHYILKTLYLDVTGKEAESLYNASHFFSIAFPQIYLAGAIQATDKETLEEFIFCLQAVARNTIEILNRRNDKELDAPKRIYRNLIGHIRQLAFGVGE